MFPFDMDPSYLSNLTISTLNYQLEEYMPNYDHVLRPEIISQNSKPIMADIKKPFLRNNDVPKNQNDLEDFADLLHVSLHLQSIVIPKVVAELDEMKSVCITS